MFQASLTITALPTGNRTREAINEIMLYIDTTFDIFLVAEGNTPRTCSLAMPADMPNTLTLTASSIDVSIDYIYCIRDGLDSIQPAPAGVC